MSRDGDRSSDDLIADARTSSRGPSGDDEAGRAEEELAATRPSPIGPCPACGRVVFPAPRCPACGERRPETAGSGRTAPLGRWGHTERAAILDEAIATAVARGYRMERREGLSAVLARGKVLPDRRVVTWGEFMGARLTGAHVVRIRVDEWGNVSTEELSQDLGG